MPAFFITYTYPTTCHDIKHETEWICPEGYDSARARASFERQFPAAAVVHVDEIMPEGSIAATR